jgi:hypothetical protein
LGALDRCARWEQASRKDVAVRWLRQCGVKRYKVGVRKQEWIDLTRAGVGVRSGADEAFVRSAVFVARKLVEAVG